MADHGSIPLDAESAAEAARTWSGEAPKRVMPHTCTSSKQSVNGFSSKHTYVSSAKGAARGIVIFEQKHVFNSISVAPPELMWHA